MDFIYYKYKHTSIKICFNNIKIMNTNKLYKIDLDNNFELFYDEENDQN